MIPSDENVIQNIKEFETIDHDLLQTKKHFNNIKFAYKERLSKKTFLSNLSNNYNNDNSTKHNSTKFNPSTVNNIATSIFPSTFSSISTPISTPISSSISSPMSTVVDTSKLIKSAKESLVKIKDTNNKIGSKLLNLSIESNLIDKELIKNEKIFQDLKNKKKKLLDENLKLNLNLKNEGIIRNLKLELNNILKENEKIRVLISKNNNYLTSSNTPASNSYMNSNLNNNSYMNSNSGNSGNSGNSYLNNNSYTNSNSGNSYTNSNSGNSYMNSNSGNSYTNSNSGNSGNDSLIKEEIKLEERLLKLKSSLRRMSISNVDNCKETIYIWYKEIVEIYKSLFGEFDIKFINDNKCEISLTTKNTNNYSKQTAKDFSKNFSKLDTKMNSKNSVIKIVLENQKLKEIKPINIHSDLFPSFIKFKERCIKIDDPRIIMLLIANQDLGF